MAYDKTTKRLYVDTANNRGITPWEVAQCIGDYRTAAHGRDVGMLCSSPKINMWAKHKPVRHSTKGLLSDIDGGYKGADGDCGIVPAPMSSEDLTALYDTGSGQIVPAVLTDEVNRGWTLKLPRGLDSGEPYRLRDFEEYIHDSRPPFSPLYIRGTALEGEQEIQAASYFRPELFLLDDYTLSVYADSEKLSKWMGWDDVMPVIGDMYAGLIAVRKYRSGTLPFPGKTAKKMVVGSRISDAGTFSVSFDIEDWVKDPFYMIPVLFAENYDDSVAIADREVYALPHVPVFQMEPELSEPVITISEGTPAYKETLNGVKYYTIDVTVQVHNPSPTGTLSLVTNTATVSASLTLAQTFDIDDADVLPNSHPGTQIGTFSVTLALDAANSHTVAVSLNGGEYTESKDFNWLLS